MTKCKTCEASINLDSKYCWSCGAKNIAKRLSFKNLFEDAFSLITNLDIPFFKTVKFLLTKPEKVTLGYIEGKRKIINSPIQFTLIVLSIYGLFQFFFSDFLDMIAQLNILSGFEAGFKSSGKEAVAAEKIGNIIGWMQKHNQFLNFFLIPIMGILSLLFYRKNRYNLAEHIAIALYAISFSIFLVIMLGLIAGPFRQAINIDYYIGISAIIQIGSISWILQRSLKGAYYKPVILLVLSFLILIILFAVFLRFLLFFIIDI